MFKRNVKFNLIALVAVLIVSFLVVLGFYLIITGGLSQAKMLDNPIEIYRAYSVEGLSNIAYFAIASLIVFGSLILVLFFRFLSYQKYKKHINERADATQ